MVSNFLSFGGLHRRPAALVSTLIVVRVFRLKCSDTLLESLEGVRGTDHTNVMHNIARLVECGILSHSGWREPGVSTDRAHCLALRGKVCNGGSRWRRKSGLASKMRMVITLVAILVLLGFLPAAFATLLLALGVALALTKLLRVATATPRSSTRARVALLSIVGITTLALDC